MLSKSIEYIDFDSQVPHVSQQSQEWLEQRAGHISASRISDVLAGGKDITREKYKIELAIERLTGNPSKNGFKNSHMERGNLLEPEARSTYSLIHDVDVVQVGFIKHPSIKWLGASPDGLIGGDGLIEIKCPTTHVHVTYIMQRIIPRNYMMQMQLQMAVTAREYCDFVSYCENIPPRLRLLTIRIVRDDDLIHTLEQAAVKFDQEINELVTELRAL